MLTSDLRLLRAAVEVLPQKWRRHPLHHKHTCFSRACAWRQFRRERALVCGLAFAKRDDVLAEEQADLLERRLAASMARVKIKTKYFVC